MTSFEPVQAGPYLAPSDPPDLANISKAIVDWAATRSNMRFASTTARDAAIPALVEGMECVTGAGAALTKWRYFAAAWNDITVVPWTTYVPAWTLLTLGNGSVAARYSRTGKTFYATIKLTFGSTTTVTGVFYPSMPVAFAAAGILSGVVWAFDASATLWATGALLAGNYLLLPQRATATTPWTWAVGDTLIINITGEVA